MAIVLVCSVPAAAKAAELVMFESSTCAWCDRWHAEIGPVYPKTTEGACAPLRRVDIHGPLPEDLRRIDGVIYTPTFVLVDGGDEFGRLVGYPGDEFFWTLLDDQLAKLPDGCPK